MARSLSKGAVKIIEQSVEEVFDRLKKRFLGPGLTDKPIYVGHIQDISLRGLFEAAAKEEGSQPNQTVLSTLIRIAEKYIDATKEQTKARLVAEIQAFLRNASRKGIKTDLHTALGGKLADVWKATTDQIHTIIDAETHTAKNISIMDGILKVNAAAGVDDPTVFFIVVRDNVLCKECKRLHLLDNGVTPRVWKLSEVGQGYHKKGEPNPKIGGLHPHCRCTMATLLPGYGFDKAGMVTYISRTHDEYIKQHGG
jgi:hypothetical protein